MNYFLDAQLMSKYRLQNPQSIMADEKLPKFMQYAVGDNSKEVMNMIFERWRFSTSQLN